MCSAYVIFLTAVVVCCAHSQGKQNSADRFSATSSRSSLHRLVKRGIPRFRERFGGFPLKRSDNHINVIPEYPSKPAESNIANNIMDEFMLFLTLKETGMLDLCLNTANMF